MTEIQAPSSASECSRLRKVIVRLASNMLRNPLALTDVELAVGEAFSNVVKYGRQDGTVRVKLENSPCRELAIELEYPGQEFDTDVSYPCDPYSGNGGFGRYIMEKVMDSMHYTFDGDITRLRITKKA